MNEIIATIKRKMRDDVSFDHVALQKINHANQEASPHQVVVCLLSDLSLLSLRSSEKSISCKLHTLQLFVLGPKLGQNFRRFSIIMFSSLSYFKENNFMFILCLKIVGQCSSNESQALLESL